MVFRAGALVLIIGVILSGYGSLTIQGLFEKMWYMSTHLMETVVTTGMGPSPVQIVEQQLFLMQLLQLIGLGLAVLGAIMLVYGLGGRERE